MKYHQAYMKIALAEAEKAFQKREIPIGAVIINDAGRILSKAHNESITRKDPTAHAEILALRQAAETVKNYRLSNTKLYVTIEPCLMCAGALIQARVEEVIFGACDPKGGALKSLYKVAEDDRLNHQIKVTSGILESDCAEIIHRFFKERRGDKKDNYLSGGEVPKWS